MLTVMAGKAAAQEASLQVSDLSVKGFAHIKGKQSHTPPIQKVAEKTMAINRVH